MADVFFQFDFQADANFTIDIRLPLDGIGTAIDHYWRLEEASGTRLDHLRTAPIDLTDVNSVGQAVGKIGNAADFDRASSQELVGGVGDLNFNGSADFAGLFWASVDDNTSAGTNVQGPAIGKWRNSDRGWIVTYDQFADEWQFVVSTNGSDAFATAGTGTFISTALAMVYFDYDSATGVIRCSLNNGTLASASPGTMINQSGDPFRIGAVRFEGVAGLNDYFEGQIDEALIFNRKLTADERAAFFGNGAARNLAAEIDVGFSFSMEATADFGASLGTAFEDLTEIADGLRHYWRCEIGGGTLFDVRGTGDLTAGTPPPAAAGKVGNARDYNRASSHENRAASSTIMDVDGSTDFTIKMWVTSDDLVSSGDRGLFAKGNSSINQRQFGLFHDVSPTDNFRWVQSANGSTNEISVQPSFVISASTFYLLTIKYNSSSGLLSLSIDNETSGSKFDSATSSGTIFQSNQPLTVGSIFSTGNGFHDGLMDEILVWDRLTTVAEDDAIWSNGMGVNVAQTLFRFLATSMTAEANFQAALTINDVPLAFNFQADADFSTDLIIPTVDLAFSFEALSELGAVAGVDRTLAEAMTAEANFQMDLFTSNVDALTDPFLGLGGQFGEGVDRMVVSGVGGNIASPPQWQAETLLDLMATLDYPMGDHAPQTAAAAAASAHDCCFPTVSILSDWFGKVFVLPLSIDAGLVLTDQSIAMEVYSSYLDTSISLDSFVNNVGAGITLGGGFPSLPTSLAPQTGFPFTLEISRLGPPSFSGTLDFTFDIPQTIMIPVTGTRTRLFSVQPNKDVVERLLWRSDVIRRLDESEQRRALRYTPRQEITYAYGVAGLDRQILENLVFDGHGRFFGLPVWWEPTSLTSAVSPTDTVLNVASTDYADYRVGGLVVVWQDARTFEVFQIQALTSNTITLTSEADNTHPVAKTVVMPVRLAAIAGQVGGSRQRRNRVDQRIRWRVLDNDSDLSNTSAFPTYDGKVLLDEPNWIADSLRDSLTRRVTVIDADLGPFDIVAEAAVDRRVHPKVFLSTSRQRLWEVRRLLHALKGQVVSFWIPTFYDDLTPTQDVVSANNTLDIDNQGYADLVQARAPRNALRLLLKDGTTVLRKIQSAVELSATEERIQVDAAWGLDATVEEIDRVELLTKVRINSDEVEIRHQDARGTARITAPLIEVIE